MARTGRVDRDRMVGVGRSGPDLVDSIHCFPACATMIGARQLALVADCQVFQLLGQMRTQGRSLLRRVDVCCLGFRHTPSMCGDKFCPHSFTHIERAGEDGLVEVRCKAETGIVIPMSGAGGESAPRKRSEATPAQPPRTVLFYTLPELFPARAQGELGPLAFCVRRLAMMHDTRTEH